MLVGKHADFITRQVQIEVDPCDMDTIHFFYTDRQQNSLGPRALHSSCLNQASVSNESVTFFNISQTFSFVPYCEKVFTESDMDVIDFCKETLGSDSDFLPFELNIVQVQYFRPRDIYMIVASKFFKIYCILSNSIAN